MSKYDYSYEYSDKYCYKDTNILINKMGIKDKDILAEFESKYTSSTISEALVYPIGGDFSLDHLKKIHKHIFYDIYYWAGEIREVNISKGLTFCPVNNIVPQFNILYKELVEDNFLMEISDRSLIVERLSYYFGEVNLIHPFREGNGRTQRLYITYLSELAGYNLDTSNISSREMIEACYEAAKLNYKKMEELIDRSLSEIPEEERSEYRSNFNISY